MLTVTAHRRGPYRYDAEVRGPEGAVWRGPEVATRLAAEATGRAVREALRTYVGVSMLLADIETAFDAEPGPGERERLAENFRSLLRWQRAIGRARPRPVLRVVAGGGERAGGARPDLRLVAGMEGAA